MDFVAVSPNGLRIAGVTATDTGVAFDLANHSARKISVSTNVFPIAWGMDSNDLMLSITGLRLSNRENELANGQNSALENAGNWRPRRHHRIGPYCSGPSDWCVRILDELKSVAVISG
jgi:hypothetical protein